MLTGGRGWVKFAKILLMLPRHAHRKVINKDISLSDRVSP